ncbi:MAG: drug/metabolite transporter (DMT)-like permease [Flavobacteriales bacterium]|jgi:drug/metabolite transporter (DMT)-like permease
MWSKYGNYILLQLVVLIFGLTGPLGKMIDANEDVIVFYRLLFAVIGILVYFKISKYKIDRSKKVLQETWFIGVIVGVHWLTFFGAIKASNVSVALICFSSSTLFSAILEPLYFKRKVILYEVILGLAIIVGLYFLVKDPNKPFFQSQYALGMVLSVFSALLASWFTVMNAVLVRQGRRAKNISFLTLVFAFIPVLIYLPIANGTHLLSALSIDGMSFIYISILGLLCTSFAYLVSIDVMKEISPFSVTISVMLEPIYSIVLAVIIWPDSEKMQPTFYIGAACILGIIALNAIFKFIAKRKLRISQPIL